MQSKTRSNKQIWRLAEWLYINLIEDYTYSYSGGDLSWHNEEQKWQNQCYDKAAELLKKIENREFTGDDNHGD